MSLKNVKGFTLIEALISIFIVIIIVLSITHLITYAFFSTRDRFIMECLINAKSSAIEACRAGINLNQIQCGGLVINIETDKSCNNIPIPSNPWQANCENVTFTISYKNFQHTSKDLICRFWDGK